MRTVYPLLERPEDAAGDRTPSRWGATAERRALSGTTFGLRAGALRGAVGAPCREGKPGWTPG